MRRRRQSSLPLTLRWRAEGSERLFVAKGGKCSRQREGCGSGRRERGVGSPETDRGWCAGALRVQGALDMGERGPLGNSWSLKRRPRL